MNKSIGNNFEIFVHLQEPEDSNLSIFTAA